MKVAYICHPVSGDVKGNIEKILAIIREINLTEPETVPFAPYLSDVMAMDDDIPEERDRGIRNGLSLFKRGIIDEVRLYGDRISKGMSDEVELAYELGIKVKDYIHD